jgi:hypothetical protein
MLDKYMTKIEQEHEKKTLHEMVYMHECGHALMAALLYVPIEKIDMNFGSDNCPATHIDLASFTNLSTPNKINFYMAGLVAEEIYVSLVSQNKSHFAHPYAQNIFNQKSYSNAEIDFDEVKNILRLQNSDYLDIDHYKNIAQKMLENHHPLLGKLWKNLVNAGGRLDNQQIASIISKPPTL